MSKLWKTKRQLETSPVKPIPKMREGQQPRLEEVSPTLLSRGRSGGPLVEVTKMMKNLQLSQVEAQKTFENELAFLRDVFTKVPPPTSAHAPATYYPPRLHQQRKNLRQVLWKHLTLFSVTADPDATIAANFLRHKLWHCLRPDPNYAGQRVPT